MAAASAADGGGAMGGVAAGSSDSSCPAVATGGGGGTRGVWLSLDPRTGQLNVYPGRAAAKLETAQRMGGRSSVELKGLGPHLDGCSVEFSDVFSRPVQKSVRGGKRDVCRVEIADETQKSVVVNVVNQGRSWKIADFEADGITETREVDVPQECIVGQAPVDRSGRAPDPVGHVALWEWCLIRRPGQNMDTVLDDDWGIYSEPQNDHIEAAYRIDTCASTTITIGVRSFEIVFANDRAGYHEQFDLAHGKLRVVRRRMVTPEERQGRYQSAAPALANNCMDVDDGECPVCCEEFADTRTMPVVQLPGCGHKFHGACIQEIADKRSSCPLCRSDVDWRDALTTRRSSNAP